MRNTKNDTGELVPLLSDIESSKNVKENGASFFGAVLNISTTMIGAGIMSIPATIKVLGIIPGFIAILVVAYLVEVTVEFMLRYSQSGRATTYAGLMGVSFGRVGSLAVQICVVITNLGCLIIYLIIIGDVLCGNEYGGTLHLGILQQWFGIHSWNSRPYALLFLVLFVMLPVVLLRRIVHPIRAELNKPSDMNPAVRISLIICVTLYFAIGFIGYLLFCDSIMADILVNFDQNSDTQIGRSLNNIVRLSYAIHLVFVYPIMNFSLRANIDELLFPKRPNLASDTKRFVSLTCVLLAVPYIIAIAIPNIWYFFQFMGSTTLVLLSFIFPGSIILRDADGISTAKDKMMAVSVILVAVVTSFITIYTNLQTSNR
ncbi:amino acid transporter AVT6C-like isoform X2 [Mercurialis annua]|uniref:amino acid transporter AVT6C-like isoform X2 n=1 Tax=Mercurialis annua TaxID=3986 RepID=UPI00215F7CA5|nr:amino acid transporter AVT6C-like isoform X2 [Mercurialis annua]